mmetsp:Transcript_3881/g.6831  ORF Transcript_3881/g.6831 Transcript_3881/m.6831 type:complete len:655 (-) Transcript_3881:325-2289(-)
MACCRGGMKGFDDTTDFVFHPRYSMYLLPVSELMKMESLLSHRQLLQSGVLKSWEPSMQGKIINISHQWLSHTSPDPDSCHFQTLKRTMERLLNGEIPFVNDYWLHTSLFLTPSVSMQEFIAAEVYIWIDYCCIPQIEETSHAACDVVDAVRSIPAYMERCSLLLIIAPVSSHKETGKSCNYASWRRRGWCRLEFMTTLLSPRSIHTMVCTGPEATPFLIHPFEAPKLPVGTGDFSCCELGHEINGRRLACDKVRAGQVLSAMIDAKVRRLKSQDRRTEAFFFKALQHWFLQDLEVSDASLPPQAKQHVTGIACAALKCKLGWTPRDEELSKKSGWTILFYAALSGNAAAIPSIQLSQAADVNAKLRVHLKHLAYMWKGVTPLFAAMAFASWDTVQALLDAKADPKARCDNGMDALFVGACNGRMENVNSWLSRFPDWNKDRNIPFFCMGISSVTCINGGGRNKQLTLECLMDSGADLRCKQRWGGEGALPCIVAMNEDGEHAMMQVVLEAGYDPNSLWKPPNMMWSLMLPGLRRASEWNPKSRPLAEMALLEGATPLHFAAKRGDVTMVKMLLHAKAEVCRNAQGLTPLDAARLFFGEEVPQDLLAAFVPGDAEISLPSLLQHQQSNGTKPRQAQETGEHSKPENTGISVVYV